jgi:sugar/nucleoside kinase (ribokinase family)
MNQPMPIKPIDVVAAGHICLDVIPQLASNQCRAEDLFVPGGLVQVGPATLALGGSVANTGLALYRLGARTRLVGKVGDDLLGMSILESLRQVDRNIAERMIVAAGEASSYTIVFSPPQVDRGFLHCPGTNDTFVAADLDLSAWQSFRILHFGYPPLMRGVVADGGRGLAEKFAAAQAAGALVSLDMAMPAAEPSTDWQQWLRRVLPCVDVFLPSIDEITLMLAGGPEASCMDSQRQSGPAVVVDAGQLTILAQQLLHLGVPIVVIKLGDQGLYLRTSEDLAGLSRRAAWRDFDWQAWQNRELLVPCFDVRVVGTTGAGDCTIAGFLMAILRGQRPEAAIRSAAAVGAHCVQSADATSNIPTWPEIESELLTSWPLREPAIRLPNWQFCRERGVYIGPADGKFVVRTE